jgi:glycosyltransferase involved in cell wall biosynthesis
LYVGGIDFLRKGIQDLPKILARLKRRNVEFQLSIIGGESAKLYRDFARAGVTSRVHWLGYMSPEEVRSVAANSDVLLLPSRSEAFGLVTAEAMSVGCVPFAYDIPSGTREIVEPDVSGVLVKFPSTQQFADAIIERWSDPSTWRHLRANAIARARRLFSLEVAVNSYIVFIISLVQREARKRTPVDFSILRDTTGKTVPKGRLSEVKRAARAIGRRLLTRFPRLVRYAWTRIE